MDSCVKSPPGVWPNHQDLWLDTNTISLPRGKPVRKTVFIRAKPGDAIFIGARGEIPIYSPQTYWSPRPGHISTRTNKDGIVELVIGPATSLVGCSIVVNQELRKIEYVHVTVYEPKE